MQNRANAPLSRKEVLRAILNHRWVKFALSLWAVVAAYDTALSQVIPASWGEQFPKVRELIGMTSGWLPFWAWLLILALLLTMASFEYAFRRRFPVVGIEHRRSSPLIGVFWIAGGLLLVTGGAAMILRGVTPYFDHPEEVPAPSPVATPVTPSAPALPQVQSLPPNAKFTYHGKVYWAMPRRYTKEEAADMRTALREIYDCINSQSAPIVSTWDGPATMFTRDWLKIIQGVGPSVAVEKLNDIRNTLIGANQNLEAIVSKRPYYQQDLRTIIDESGATGDMGI
jgi:hypothetical protein